MGFNFTFAQKCDFPHTFHAYHTKESMIQNDIFTRENMQHTVVSESGLFAVHYDLSGFNAVSTVDNNNNNIPDYVDSTLYYIDLAYSSEVEMLGFEFDEYDANAGGTEMYDIYIKELANSPYYGGARPEGAVINPENEIVNTSFVVIDNDFSSEDNKYNTTGIDGLKITLFHEFFHSIQFQITRSDFRVMGEMTATFMEYRFFPEIKDYIDWASEWFESPSTMSISNSINPSDGYGMSVFFHYIYDTFGDGVVLDMWKGMGRNENDTESLDRALSARGKSLAESFCEFTEWMFRTGDNAVDGYGFRFAPDLPNLTLSNSIKYNGFEENISEQLIPFTFSPNRVIKDKDNGNPDTLIAMIVNTDYDNAIRNRTVLANGELSVANKDVLSNNFNEIDLSYRASADPLFCYNFVELVGKEFVEAFPNPFRKNSDSEMYLPVPEGAEDIINFDIYTVDMKLVSSGSNSVIDFENKNVIRVDDIDMNLLSAGVYIYKTESDGNVKLGKFVVQ